MKVNIYTSDKMVYGIQIDGGAVEAEYKLAALADNIQKDGVYKYISERSNRATIVPWHAIVAIEQAEHISDTPYRDKEVYKGEE